MRGKIALIALLLAVLLTADTVLAETVTYSRGTSSMSTYVSWSSNLRTQYSRTSEPIGQGRGGYYWVTSSSTDVGYCGELLCNGWGKVGLEIFDFPLSITPSQVSSASIKISSDSHNDACCHWYEAVGFDVYINGVKVGSDTSASAGVSAKTSTISIPNPSTTLKNGANNIYVVFSEGRTGYGILSRVGTVSIEYQAASTCTLSVTSSPSSDIYVDGIWKGTYSTASIPNIAAGSHTVKCTKSGYQDDSKSVTCSAGQTVSVACSPQILPTTGDLSVTSSPGGADIYVDGQWKGTYDSVTVRSLAPGSHTVKCTKSGYSDYSTTATVTAGQTASITCSLQAVPATGTVQVTVSLSPAASGGADIYVDGSWKGTYDTASIPNVAAGSRTVRCSKSGYGDYTTTATVPAGGSVSVQCSLAAVAAPVAPCVEDWTCTPWSSCSGGYETRTCTDRNACGTTYYKPVERQECVAASTKGDLWVTVTGAPDADIYVDGVWKDRRSTAKIPGLVPGYYRVSCVKEGYTSSAVAAEVPAGGSGRATCAMSALVSPPAVETTAKCQAGYACKDSQTRGYRNADCTWESIETCADGCHEGYCTFVATKKIVPKAGPPSLPSTELTKEQEYALKAKLWQGIRDGSSERFWADNAAKGRLFFATHFKEVISDPLQWLVPSADIQVLATGAFIEGLKSFSVILSGGESDPTIQIGRAAVACAAEPKFQRSGFELHKAAAKIADAFAQKQNPLAADLEYARDLAKCYEKQTTDQRLNYIFALAQVEAQRELSQAAAIPGQVVRPPAQEPTKSIASGALRIEQVTFNAQPARVGPSGQTATTASFRTLGQADMAPAFVILRSSAAQQVLAALGQPLLTVSHEISVKDKGAGLLWTDKPLRRVVVERQLVPQNDLLTGGLQWRVVEAGKPAVEVRTSEEMVTRLYSVSLSESFTGTELGVPGCRAWGLLGCDQEWRHTLFAEVQTKVSPTTSFFQFSGDKTQAQRSNEVVVAVTKA